MKCCEKNEANGPIDQELNLDGLICYCFKYSKKELYHAIKNGNEQSNVDDIKAKINDPGCFCETANPSGKCCLADINQFIKIVKSQNLSK